VKNIIDISDDFLDLSVLETLVFNLYVYGLFSFSLSYHYRKMATDQARLRGEGSGIEISPDLTASL
jgi:hypothetical protein